MLRPVDLRTDDATLTGKLSALMQTRSSVVLPMRKLLQLAGLEFPERRVTLAISEQLARVLDRIGYALEPDYRYYGWSPELNDKVVIFKAECGGPINPERPAYLETKVKIDAMALSVATNGNALGEGFEAIKREIATGAEFSHVERARLLAYAFASLASPPKLKRKKRAFLESKVFPVTGASILFGFAILSAHVAVSIDHSAPMPQLSAADIRHECSLVTDDAFHAECLRQAQLVEGAGSKNPLDSARALPAMQ
jgi:hypothetical protein